MIMTILTKTRRRRTIFETQETEAMVKVSMIMINCSYIEFIEIPPTLLHPGFK